MARGTGMVRTGIPVKAVPLLSKGRGQLSDVAGTPATGALMLEYTLSLPAHAPGDLQPYLSPAGVASTAVRPSSYIGRALIAPAGAPAWPSQGLRNGTVRLWLLPDGCEAVITIRPYGEAFCLSCASLMCEHALLASLLWEVEEDAFSGHLPIARHLVSALQRTAERWGQNWQVDLPFGQLGILTSHVGLAGTYPMFGQVLIAGPRESAQVSQAMLTADTIDTLRAYQVRPLWEPCVRCGAPACDGANQARHLAERLDTPLMTWLRDQPTFARHTVRWRDNDVLAARFTVPASSQSLSMLLGPLAQPSASDAMGPLPLYVDLLFGLQQGTRYGLPPALGNWEIRIGGDHPADQLVFLYGVLPEAGACQYCGPRRCVHLEVYSQLTRA